MENNEKNVLNEEQTEAVSGGAELVIGGFEGCSECTETDLPPVLDLEGASGPFKIYKPTEVKDVLPKTATATGAAPSQKKGLLGWFKGLFGNF